MKQEQNSDGNRRGHRPKVPRSRVAQEKGNGKRGCSASSNSEPSKEEATKPTSKEVPTYDQPKKFPRRLMELLRRNERPDAIKWLPDGKMFAMHTGKIDEVLSKNFQGARFSSFTRTLNKW